MERLSHAARLIADIRLRANRLLEALFFAAEPHKRSKPLVLFIKEDSVRQFQDLRSIVRQLPGRAAVSTDETLAFLSPFPYRPYQWRLFEENATFGLVAKAAVGGCLHLELHVLNYKNCVEQGGADESEDPRKAALRELREETGVPSAQFLAEACLIFTSIDMNDI
ncbi:hypothetical protein SLEP1_g40581 [Rubroshorea leprosula]|uniref:Nudix hydrolase domain-containing protein n=1 Tax=Rubroshorea leprosula TaxID=152421 RepID=A0AAV5L4A8_9ROSI|nr:hypothetical protein SLEP1_g40581 [Rubroshorea leprosula]